MMNDIRYFYIYNPEQSDFFIKNGATPIGVGKGKRNDVYVKFPRTDKEDEIFSRWVDLCNKVKSKKTKEIKLFDHYIETYRDSEGNVYMKLDAVADVDYRCTQLSFPKIDLNRLTINHENHTCIFPLLPDENNNVCTVTVL